MEFAGLILAGGEGKRWGGPKAWAELPDGTTFLDACFEALRKAGARNVLATLPSGTEFSGRSGLTTVALPSAGLDMFASLSLGLARLVDDTVWKAVAVLPVDHPLVHSNTIAALSHTAAMAAIPSFQGKHGHPIWMQRPVAESIVDGTLTGPTLREVLRWAEAIDVPVDDPGVVTNCNTPEALVSALDPRSRNPKFKTEY